MSAAMFSQTSLICNNNDTSLFMWCVRRANDVVVKVYGPRPENIVFLVHEVFEALIFQSFHGVSYDFFVPCTDCIKAVSTQ